MSSEPTAEAEPRVTKSSKSKKVAKTMSMASSRPSTELCSIIEKSQKSKREDRQRPVKVHIEVEPGTEELNEEEKGKVRCAKICIRVFFLILNIIPMAMIILGSIYYQECPLEPLIPLWLIVAGSLYLVYSMFDIYEWATDHPRHTRRPVIIVLSNFFVQIAMFIWLICGSVWIYSVFSDRNYYEKDSEYYCNKAVYITAFATATAGNAVIGAFFILCFCIGLFAIGKK